LAQKTITMNIRTQTKYVIYTITVLTAALLSIYIESIITEYIPEKSYLTVIIDMILIIAVFIPVIAIIEKVIKKAASSYVGTAKNVSGNSKAGVYLAFFIALIILFVLFAIVKHNLTPITDLKNIFR